MHNAVLPSSTFRAPRPAGRKLLTASEMAIADLVADGAGNREIAVVRGISEETVKRHISNIFDKTGLGTRTELAGKILHDRHRIELSAAAFWVDVFRRVSILNFPKDSIVALCQKYGPRLALPKDISGANLMLAIAGEESSYGANCTPRHEPAYDHGGYYGDHSALEQKLLAEYGSAAACSYGPWQVLLCNAPGFTPTQLMQDPDACARAFVAHMNSFVLGFRKPQTISQIAETYNSGNFGPNMSGGVLKYANGVLQNYCSATLPSTG